MVTLLTSIKRGITATTMALCLVFTSLPAKALQQAQFEHVLSQLQSEQFEPVAAFLKEHSELAKSDPDYTVLMLNHAFLANQKSQLVVDKAAVIDVIRQAQGNLQSFPEYLDIQLGIAAVASRIGEWQIATEQLINLLKVSREIDNNWKWGKVGGMADDTPEEFMIQSVLPYSSKLFRLETPETDQMLVRLSEALIQYYPKKVYGYANLGSFYAVTGKKDKAREYYEKALEVDPDDEVVKQNLEYLNRS